MSNLSVFERRISVLRRDIGTCQRQIQENRSVGMARIKIRDLEARIVKNLNVLKLNG